MSERIAYLPVFSSMMSPIATPATGARSGTPASIIDSVPPQTEAIDDDPFDSRMSDTTLIVNGGAAFEPRGINERGVAEGLERWSNPARGAGDRMRVAFELQLPNSDDAPFVLKFSLQAPGDTHLPDRLPAFGLRAAAI